MPRALILLGAAAAIAAAGLAPSSTTAATAQDDDRLAHGESVFTYWCAPCHAPGPGHPGTQALAAKYNGELPEALLERSDLTPEVIETFVRSGISVMAPFRKTEIGDADLDALSAYIVASAHEDD